MYYNKKNFQFIWHCSQTQDEGKKTRGEIEQFSSSLKEVTEKHFPRDLGSEFQSLSAKTLNDLFPTVDKLKGQFRVQGQKI